MRRRIMWATAAVAVLLLVPSAPASAAEVRFHQPDGDVTTSTPIEVRLEKSVAEPVHRVHLSLLEGGEVVGERITMACRGVCEDSDTSRTYVLPDGGEFDPRTRAPFADDAPLANGAYGLRVKLDRGRFFEPQTFHGDMHLAVPPTAPKGLRADVDGTEVVLTWSPSPEPDLEGYRVERRGGGSWQKLTTTTSTTFVDEPGEGTHTYRVVAERPDGRDGLLEAASAEKQVEVVPGDDDGDEPGEGDPAERDGEAGADGDEGDGGEGRDGDGGADGGDAERDQSGGSEQDDAPRRSRSGAEAPSTGSGRTGAIPRIGERDSDGYAAELDYGDAGDGEAADDVRVANPGGWRGTVDSIFDAERVAVPVAAGLVMTGMGLHLWRWLRVPLP